MPTKAEWSKDQVWESEWWGNCLNTFGEETKQISYAHRMGLVNVPDAGHWPAYDMGGKSVLDIGGGPSSILLKTLNVTSPTVVDPCAYPKWVSARYKEGKIEYVEQPGEEFKIDRKYDEVWIYNVLQHVIDPEKLIKNAWKHGTTIRIFEWIDLPPHQGHPHELKAAKLDKWLGGKGTTEQLSENGCFGLAYYGVFTK